MSAPARGRETDVVRVEAIPLADEFPPGQRYGSSRGRVAARVATLVRLETRGGAVGWGEGFGPPAAVCVLVAELAELVRGRPVDRIVPFVWAFYAPPFRDAHNRMKEALTLLGRLDEAWVRPPLLRLESHEREKLRKTLQAVGCSNKRSTSCTGHDTRAVETTFSFEAAQAKIAAGRGSAGW